MDELVDEMKVYYGLRAPIYDRSMGYDDPGTVAALRPITSEIGRLFASRTVLEVACGPAFWTSWYCARARRTVATDFNPSMLRQAKKKEAVSGNATLVAADAYALPFRRRAFDAAFAGDWLAHVPGSRIEGFLDGLHAALVPGSPIVFVDQLPGPRSIEDFDGEGNHVQTRALPDGSTYRVIKHFFSDVEVRALLEGYAGSPISIERYPDVRRIVVSYRTSVHGS